MPVTDSVFAGSIPKLYDAYLVPLIFEPYAVDLVQRLRAKPLSSVLELAAGTGVVTRLLASTLHDSVAITATDLNQAMLDQAAAVGTARPVEWKQADAMQLPFPDESFDAVVCQFGAMFFPDKGRAFAQARRVLRPGGLFIFNVWDKIEENEIVEVVSSALASVFPADPPRFMERTPHGYHDKARIARDVADGGFAAAAHIETVAARSRAPSAQIAATAFCQGSPLRTEIEQRSPPSLTEATDAAARAVERRFGSGPVDARIQAHVVTVSR